MKAVYIEQDVVLETAAGRDELTRATNRVDLWELNIIRGDMIGILRRIIPT